MELFSDYYQDFPNPIGTSWPIFDRQDKEFQYDIVTEHLPDRQCIEFSPDVGKASPDSCDIIATHYNNLSNGAGNNAPLYLYESTMESFGMQEIINPGSMPSNEQAAAAAFYASPVGADHGERPAYPVPQRTGREEIMTCDANHLLYHTPGGTSSMELVSLLNKTTSWEVKDRKTDPVHISKSVFETNVPVPLKKSNWDRCKSWPDSSASKDREEKLNPELDVIRRDPDPESLPNIVTKDQRAESRKDYIHVRARRGQATDSHSLAERVRRQKINDRMNILQSLVPNCNKITNKALVLEEIIKYVHSLQNQVEILSMKVASITPIFTFDNQITGHHFKELLPLEATKDPMFAYRLGPHYVDDSHTVATFIQEC